MSLDKRKERRNPINILCNKYIEGDPHVCRAVNLSQGGMLLYKVFEPDLPQEEVSVEFIIPGSNRIVRADGVTLSEHRWSRAHGVRFTRMADEDRALIASWLRGEIADDKAAAL
jgi:hypothetical protein